MKTYVYRDNKAGRKIVFKCDAIGITQADILYEAETGNDPAKQHHIGCSTQGSDLMPKDLWPETASIADDLNDFFARYVVSNPHGPSMDRLVDRVRRLERRASELGEELLEQTVRRTP